MAGVEILRSHNKGECVLKRDCSTVSFQSSVNLQLSWFRLIWPDNPPENLVVPTVFCRHITLCFLGLHFNLLKPAGHVKHQQFNIQQLYVLPTLYLCVLYLSENKQRLVPLTA